MVSRNSNTDVVTILPVSIYDAETLKWKRDLPWSPESGQVEVSGLAVDREKKKYGLDV